MDSTHVALIILAVVILAVYITDTIGDIIVVKNLKKLINKELAELDSNLRLLKDILEDQKRG